MQTTGAAAGDQERGVIAGKLARTGVAVGARGFTLEQLQHIDLAVTKLNTVLGRADGVQRATGGVSIARTKRGGGKAYPWWILPWWKRITLGDATLQQEPPWRAQVAVVHELAHEWDAQSANWFQRAFGGGGRIVREMVRFVGDEPGPTCYGGLMAKDCTFGRVPVEEWAESVAAFVYPEYIEWLRANLPTEKEAGLRPRHEQFVKEQITTLMQMQ